MSKSKPNTTWDLFNYRSYLSDKEQQELERVNKIIEKEIAPIANKAWATAEFPFEIIPVIKKLNIPQTRYPEFFGLPSTSEFFRNIYTLELGRTDTSLGVFCGVHSGLAMESIYRGGSEDQVRRFFPAMATFDKIGCFALTEPEGGSDVSAGMRTTAKRKGDKWIINGAKRWIGNGTFADYIVTFARDVDDNNVKAFVVEKGMQGFSASKIEGKIALRTVQNADLVFDNVEVSEENRLQKINSFRDVSHEILSRTRGGVAWLALAVASRAYELSRDYAVERIQFGKPIGSFQLIQDKLVTMLSNVTTMFGIAAQLAHETDRGTATDAQAALAKSFNTSRLRETVALGRDLFGGNGIVLSYGIGKCFDDAEALYSFEGTKEMNTLIVGKHITGLSAFV